MPRTGGRTSVGTSAARAMRALRVPRRAAWLPTLLAPPGTASAWQAACREKTRTRPRRRGTATRGQFRTGRRRGRPREVDGRVPRLLRCERVRKLGGRDDRAHGADLGDVEEHEHRALDERHDRHHGKRDVSRRQEHPQSSDHTDADDVRDDHQALSIPTVDGHAGGKREQRIRHDPCEADEPSLGGRMRQREDEERVRDA
jgi:hypothetical protein